MKEYDAYLFDADGTLLDTRELIYRSFVHTARELEVPCPSRELVDAKTGIPLVRQLREVFGGAFPDDFYDRAGRVYVDHMMVVYRDYLDTFPGVHDGLAVLADMGKKLAVVTSRKRNTLTLFLEALDLARFFTVLVTPEDTPRHKPDPDPALLAMRTLEVEPAGTVFVGDAEYDMSCGKAAGTDVCYVQWGGMDYRNWPVRPDFVARTFHDLLPEGKD